MIFRRRKWVGDFIQMYGLQVGDEVLIEKIDDYHYRLRPHKNRWQAYHRSFTIFVMGDHRDVLIIPVRLLQTIVEYLEPKGHGEFKLHIDNKSPGFRFREAPGTDLSCFYNDYLLLQT